MRAILIHFLIPFFFLPSGLCVCHGTECAAEQHGDHHNESLEPGHIHEPEDPAHHPHGCPSVKQFDGQFHPEQTSVPKIVLAFLARFEPLALLPFYQTDARDEFRRRHRHNSDPPLYISQCSYLC